MYFPTTFSNVYGPFGTGYSGFNVSTVRSYSSGNSGSTSSTSISVKHSHTTEQTYYPNGGLRSNTDHKSWEVTVSQPSIGSDGSYSCPKCTQKTGGGYKCFCQCNGISTPVVTNTVGFTPASSTVSYTSYTSPTYNMSTPCPCTGGYVCDKHARPHDNLSRDIYGPQQQRFYQPVSFPSVVYPVRPVYSGFGVPVAPFF